MRRIWSATGAGFALAMAACTAEAPSNGSDGNAAPVEAANVAEPVNAIGGPVNEAAANEAAPAGVAIDLAPDGLLLVDMTSGSTRQIPFGMLRTQAVRMVAAAAGDPVGESSNDECGAGPLAFADFPGGLQLLFEDAKFAGWSLDKRTGPTYSTMNGIGIGTTRAELEAAGDFDLQETTLGHEFTLGEMSGLLSANGPSGRVTDLWAGVSCNFR